MKIYSFIIFFTCLLFSSLQADILSQNENIVQYLEEHPKVIRHTVGKKIYLNPCFLKILDQGICLNYNDEQIILPRIQSDSQGVYFKNCGSFYHKKWDYFYCYRCDLYFEEPASKNPVVLCPSCGFYDQVVYKGTW